MRTLISALILTSLLSACGQKGPLYMPHKPPVVAPLPTGNTAPASPGSAAPASSTASENHQAAPESK